MQIDRDLLLQKAGAWMLDRGWKRLTAKRRQFDQSLFEHTLVELDAMLQLLPILRPPIHFGLTEVEEQVLVASVVAHDVGKERPDWQAYILGRRGFVSDVDPVLTRSVLPELCEAMGFSGLDRTVTSVVENCVNLHMSHERGDTNVIAAMLQGSNRWLTLANLVYHVDNVASARGVFEAQAALERCPLGRHLKTGYHQVSIRGVSTTMLHRAALDAFVEAGWAPLLHFGDATLYVCSAAIPVLEPLPSRIESRLVAVLSDAIHRDVAHLVVGTWLYNVLPKPELFDYREIGAYLDIASRKMSRTSFARKKAPDRGTTVLKYLKCKGQDALALTDAELHRQSERISSALPDFLAFKFLKAALSEEMVGSKGLAIARQRYDAVFGQGSWDALSGTGWPDAARNMADTVDRFWGLPGAQFGLAVATIEELDPGERTRLLVRTLTGIAEAVYTSIPCPPARDALGRNMAAAFVQDLIHPAPAGVLGEQAARQAEFYAASKPFAGKQVKGARYLCPICNTAFEQGTKGSADFVDKPESHTNRAISHGPFGYITLCLTCTYERYLRQLLLGERARQLIIVFPRMNVGPGAGDALVRKVWALYDRAYALMVGDTGDPDQRVWLAFTPFIAEQTHNRDVYRLTPNELADVLSYRSSEDTRRKNRRALDRALKEEYGELSAANADWGTDFESWDSAVDAVRNGHVSDQAARIIRADVYRLQPQMRLVCQTPHLIILPVSYQIALGQDADTNQALRRVFIALLLGLVLDASVAIVADSEGIDFQGGEGVAFVPPVANARELIGSNWVPVCEAERWFRAIGLASILADAGQYSERSSLFQVLTAPTVGHILRRIEQKRARERRSLGWRDIEYLRAFEEVRP